MSLFFFCHLSKNQQIFIIISYCQHNIFFVHSIYLFILRCNSFYFIFVRCCDKIRRYRLRYGMGCCFVGVHFILIYPIFIEFNARIAFHILLLKICLFRSFVHLSFFFCFVLLLLFWCVRDLCVEISIDRWSMVQQPR